MRPPAIKKKRIGALRRELVARRYAIPKLQRNFVWDAGRAAKLLDSIYRNIPIGSIFLWEMERKAANLIRQSSAVLPHYDPDHKQIWFVIDGQQRLSVIHQAFAGETKINDRGREIHFSRLCFVAAATAEQRDSQRIVYRRPLGKHLVPLVDILALDWRVRLKGKPAWMMKQIADCRRRILNYPVPIVTVAQASLEEIGEVFIRVNSQGMRITSADRAIAIMGEMDIRAMAEDVRQRLAAKSFRLEGVDPILMGFNLIHEKPNGRGVPPKLEIMAVRWSRELNSGKANVKQFEKTWDRYQRAFLSAVDYLRSHFRVYDESYLPSANMPATLASYFYHHPGQPHTKARKEIRKWFWATGVAQRYSGRGYHQNLVADAQLFADLARGKPRTFVLESQLDPIATIQNAEYSSKAARTRVYFCLLAASRPRYLENGEPINLSTDIASYANVAHRHHIFPKGQLHTHFPASVYNGLCNICFLVSQDNLAIGMKLPRVYLGACRDENRQRFERVARSHLIPTGPSGGVWQKGTAAAFEKFRSERLRLICAAFEEQAGMRIFRR